MNTESERRNRMVAAVVEGTDLWPLRAVVQQLLDDGVDRDILLADLDQIQDRLTDVQENRVLDVMDLLVGIGAPKYRLSRKTPPG